MLSRTNIAVLLKCKMNRILLHLEGISAFCAFDRTLFSSFDVKQKVTTKWALDGLSFVACWFSSFRWLSPCCGLCPCCGLRSSFWFSPCCGLRPCAWIRSGLWFPFTRSNLSCQLTHPNYAISKHLLLLCFPNLLSCSPDD